MTNFLQLPKFLIFVFSLCIISCTTTPNYHIEHLNGYWEIEKVILSDGNTKEYNFNSTIDFFEVQDTLGIRKKVQPRLNGNYIISKDKELFSVKIENDSLKLYYKTNLMIWKENILLLQENKMIVKNESGNMYFYKRYKKIKL